MEQQERESKRSRTWIGVLIAATVLCVLLTGDSPHVGSGLIAAAICLVGAAMVSTLSRK